MGNIAGSEWAGRPSGNLGKLEEIWNRGDMGGLGWLMGDLFNIFRSGEVAGGADFGAPPDF